MEAAQTGVSRYGELRPHWTYVYIIVQVGSNTKSSSFIQIFYYNCFSYSYSKEEKLDVQKLQTFTFLLIPASKYKQFQNTHKPIAKVKGFSKIKINWKNWILLDFIVEGKIYVLQQRIVSCQY